MTAEMKKIFFIVLLFTMQVTCIAQPQKLPAIIINDGDTMPVVYMRAIEVVGNLNPEAAANLAKYNKLRRDVLRAYPYAKIAAAKLKEINDHAATLTRERDRKEYIKSTEKAMKEQFEGDLKKLTIGQGRILIKLIDRQTGNTSFELVKDLRGGLQAFMWQGLARLFGSNLKSEYDPNGEDSIIESIVLQIESGTLKIPEAYMTK